jgi:hypothetical protein
MFYAYFWFVLSEWCFYVFTNPYFSSFTIDLGVFGVLGLKLIYSEST